VCGGDIGPADSTEDGGTSLESNSHAYQLDIGVLSNSTSSYHVVVDRLDSYQLEIEFVISKSTPIPLYIG
jgi:hypothetical protein